MTARRLHRAAAHRALATIVALSLLTMPVTYRGGSEAAHAHTIFQLWGDIRGGSFTHHVPPDEHAVAHTGGEPHLDEPHVDVPETTVGAVDPDAPTVSSAHTPNVRGPMLVLPPSGAAAPSAGSVLAAGRDGSRPTGVVLAPIIPPPRHTPTT